jgi:hypothetical protein
LALAKEIVGGAVPARGCRLDSRVRVAGLEEVRRYGRVVGGQYAIGQGEGVAGGVGGFGEAGAGGFGGLEEAVVEGGEGGGVAVEVGGAFVPGRGEATAAGLDAPGTLVPGAGREAGGRAATAFWTSTTRSMKPSCCSRLTR